MQSLFIKELLDGIQEYGSLEPDFPIITTIKTVWINIYHICVLIFELIPLFLEN